MLKGFLLLSEKLEAAGYPVVLLMESGVAPFLTSTPDFLFHIDKENVEYVNFVDVFVAFYDIPRSMGGARLPREPKLVACNHSFYSSEGECQEELAEGFAAMARHFDYYMVEAAPLMKITAEEYAEGARRAFKPGEMPRAAETFSFIPVGYLNYDASIRYMQETEVEAYSLFYGHKRGYGRWQSERKIILTTLLDAFPDEVIRYSAGPMEWVLPDRIDLIRQLAHRPNFELGKDKSNLPTFAKAKIAITSDSDTVLTFAVCTKRPFVRCDFSSPHPLVRHKLGYDVHTPEQLVEAVSTLLKEMKESEAPLVNDASFDEYAFNLGKACDTFIAHLPFMIKGESHPDWITFTMPQVFTGKLKYPAKVSEETYQSKGRGALELKMHYDESVDYLQIEAVFPEDVNSVFTPDGPTYMIWGASGGYRNVYRERLMKSASNFLGFIDRNPAIHEAGVDGFPAFPASRINELKPEYIFIASTFFFEIIDEILAILNGKAQEE
ncbi:hypothetical protein OAN24_01535 [Pseudodesulfovibrio sp.]|nr:hypothetical protein [Pseudodesulfovibrio sp.]